MTQQLTNSAGPGVGERTIEPPFSVRGEFMRQNGPSRLAVVSVWPLLPLLSRQISVEKPSEPDISTDFVVRVVGLLPELGDVLHRRLEFLLGQMHVARESVQVLHQRDEDFPHARVRRVLECVQHHGGDVFLPLDDHCRSSPIRALTLSGRRFVEELIYLSRRLRINSGHLGEIGQGRPLDRFHSAEMAQQRALARRADAGDFLQSGLADVLLAARAVRADGEAVGLVAQPLDEIEQRIARRQLERARGRP